MAIGTLEGTTIAGRYKSLLKLTGTANDVLAADASAKYVEDGDGNDSILSLSTTRVGIGTTAPVGKLTIANGTAVSYSETTYTGDAIVIDSSGISAGDATLTAGITFTQLASTSRGACISAFQDGADVDKMGFKFATAQADGRFVGRMVIDGDGYVGIGLRDDGGGADSGNPIGPIPSYPLHVQLLSAGSTDVICIDNHSGGGGQTTDVGSILWRLSGGGYGNVYDAARISVGKDLVQGSGTSGDWSQASEIDSFIAFHTALDNTVAERMRITADGRLGIGLTAPTAPLHIDQFNANEGTTVLKLDQADVDDSFIDFIGTTASDQSASLSTETSVGALTGHIRIEVNGTHYWLAYYAGS